MVWQSFYCSPEEPSQFEMELITDKQELCQTAALSFDDIYEVKPLSKNSLNYCSCSFGEEKDCKIKFAEDGECPERRCSHTTECGFNK